MEQAGREVFDLGPIGNGCPPNTGRRGGCSAGLPAAAPSSSRKLWLAVGDPENGGHGLCEGDAIRLGRSKLRVRQLVASTSDAAQPEPRLRGAAAVCRVDPSRSDELASKPCRICWQEGASEDGPLIAPCRCKGSVEHVHLGCIRHWIRGRLNLPVGLNSCYFYRPLACELCQADYPAYVHLGEKRLPLAELPCTRAPFIVLETMPRDSKQRPRPRQQPLPGRGLHVISLADGRLVKIGRGHESDVSIEDASVSRWHATVRFREGSFVLEDHGSRYGTWVSMKRPRLFDPGVLGRAGFSVSLLSRAGLSVSLQLNPERGSASTATAADRQEAAEGTRKRIWSTAFCEEADLSGGA